MTIYLVEDDYPTCDGICEQLKASFRDAKVHPITTESEFRLRIDEIVRNRPTVVIMDVMIRWTNPTEDITKPPKEVDGPWRAGIRCQKLLHNKSPEIPVIFFSVLDKDDLRGEIEPAGAKVLHLEKHTQGQMLAEAIRKLSSG
jgi:DNA-binding NarL/FixJ family response regulator